MEILRKAAWEAAGGQGLAPLEPGANSMAAAQPELHHVAGDPRGARSAAMTFNRLLDAEIDARNPRTRSRHLPTGALSKTLPSGPAIFHADDFSLVTNAKPARAGESLIMSVAGLGPVLPGIDPGTAFPASSPARRSK